MILLSGQELLRGSNPGIRSGCACDTGYAVRTGDTAVRTFRCTDRHSRYGTYTAQQHEQDTSTVAALFFIPLFILIIIPLSFP